jgi:integrating conjugative element protein (TIGR03749 family)
MKQLFILMGIFGLLISPTLWAAETLPLTDAQIKKLQLYVPTDDESPVLIWKGEALSIQLPVKAEKRLIFPEPIEANLNGSLTNEQLRIINNDKSLYLTALKPFSSTRLYVTLKNTNQIIFLDLSTSDKAGSTPQNIILPSSRGGAAVTTVTSTAVSTVNEPNQSISVSAAENYITAIRFAWRQLFAPQRLMVSSSNFTRTPMHTTPWVTDLVYGDKVWVRPQISWVSGNTYITALQLRNKYPHTTRIDVRRDLCGDWQAAVLYPRKILQPAGNVENDSTTLFLISNKPFGDVLKVCHGGA